MDLDKHREANTGKNGVCIRPFKNRKQAREFSNTYFSISRLQIAVDIIIVTIKYITIWK
jgi:hypothetical protein